MAFYLAFLYAPDITGHLFNPGNADELVRCYFSKKSYQVAASVLGIGIGTAVSGVSAMSMGAAAAGTMGAAWVGAPLVGCAGIGCSAGGISAMYGAIPTIGAAAVGSAVAASSIGVILVVGAFHKLGHLKSQLTERDMLKAKEAFAREAHQRFRVHHIYADTLSYGWKWGNVVTYTMTKDDATLAGLRSTGQTLFGATSTVFGMVTFGLAPSLPNVVGMVPGIGSVVGNPHTISNFTQDIDGYE